MAIDVKKFLTKSPKKDVKKIDIKKFIPKKKEEPKKEEPEKPRVVGFPEHLGGGQYLTNSKAELFLSKRSQDALPSRGKENIERDHIVSVAVGGTSNKDNLQYLPNTKAGQQSGKVDIETKAIEDWKAGKISLQEARGLIAAKNQEILGLTPKQGISKPFQVIEKIDNTTAKIGNFLGKGVEKIVNSVKPKDGDKRLIEKLGAEKQPVKVLPETKFVSFLKDQGEKARSKDEANRPEAIRKIKEGLLKNQQFAPIIVKDNETKDEALTRIAEEQYDQKFKGLSSVLSIADLAVGSPVGVASKAGLGEGILGKIIKQTSKADNAIPKTKVVQAAEELPVFPKSQIKERGFISSAKEVFPKADNLRGTYNTRNTNQLAIKARTLVKENIEVAEKIATTQSDDKAVAIASELIKSYGEKAKKVKDIATKNALYDRAATIANNIARKLTESGRASQAASILSKLTPEGQVRFAAREIQKYNEVIEKSGGGILGLKKKIPELSGKQADEIITEMTAINKMPDGVEKAMRFKQLQDSIKDYVPSTLYDKLVSVWKAGLLTGLKTSGLNIASNVSHFVSETVKDIPAVAVDSVASLFSGKRSVAFTTKGVGTGLKEGFQKGIRYFKTGYDERNIAAKLDWKRVNFGKGKIARALQKYEETIFRIIGAEDQPFYYGAKARSLYDQAKAKAINEGLKGNEARTFIDNLIQNPTDDMVRYAVLDAETAVFQNKTLLGTAAKAIQNVKGGEFIIPFGKTPSAVATQIINYSPVGVVKTILSNIGKGKFDQRIFSQGIGRGLTGTAIMWLGGELVKKGLITLDRPKDEKEQKLWELEGKTPNSIKIGGKYRSIQTLGPAGNVLLIGGHFQKAYSDSGSPTLAMSNALTGSAKSFSEQTFLKGTNQFLEAVNDPGRYGEGFLGSFVSSFVPTISSDIARATDSVERNAQSTPDRIQSRIPGLRQNVEPRVNVLGEEQKRVGNFFEVLADPTRPSKEKETPLILELRRLWDKGYKSSPSLIGDKKGYEALTKEENTGLLKRAGEITESKLSKLIEDDRYKKLGDDEKSKTIENFISKSHLQAKLDIVKMKTEGLQGEELKAELKRLKESKLLTREVWNAYSSDPNK